MWEGDPVGVDPKRPLVGFALVAVLCAVLMTLSVGKGWSFDFLQPGKPIASSVGGHVERAPAPSPDAVARVEVGFPVQLSTAPLGITPAAPVEKQAAAKPAAGATEDEGSESATAQVEQDPEVAPATKADRKAEKSAGRAERKLARLEARAERRADRLALKAQRQLQKAERQVEKAAAKAHRQAEKAAEQAARDAEKALRDAAKDAAKAEKAIEKAAR